MTTTNAAERERAIEDASLTIDDFCRAERISRSTFYKLKRLRLAPEETIVPGLALRRITAQARRAWHAKLDALQASEAAELERRRRVELAKRAALIAATSPLHRSRRQAGAARRAAKGRR